MNCEDKNSFPGYIYFRDNGMDYKIGLTNNLVVRGRAYKTENPRDTVVDYFFVETYAEAEAIESEMKKAARAAGICSFDNSDEWLKRTDISKDFWDKFVRNYAKKTHAEWAEVYGTEMLDLQAKYDKAHEQWVSWHDSYTKKCNELAYLQGRLTKQVDNQSQQQSDKDKLEAFTKKHHGKVWKTVDNPCSSMTVLQMIGDRSVTLEQFTESLRKRNIPEDQTKNYLDQKRFRLCNPHMTP